MGHAGGEAREPIHPAVNLPLEMQGEVCTMSAQTPPGSPPGPRGFHSQELTDPTYMHPMKTMLDAARPSPPMSPSGLLCHGNRRKLLDMPARNFWIPRNYSHWMYSEVWVGFFFLHLRLFIVCTHSYVLYAFSNVWPCRLIVAI